MGAFFVSDICALWKKINLFAKSDFHFEILVYAECNRDKNANSDVDG
jgi:hypothetical protein